MAAAQLVQVDSEAHEDRDEQRGACAKADVTDVSAGPLRVILVLDPETGELVALPAMHLARLWSTKP